MSDQHQKLIDALFEGDASSDEVDALEQWIHADEDHALVLARQAMFLTLIHENLSECPSAESNTEVDTAIESSPRTEGRSRGSEGLRLHHGRIWGMAAAAALAAAVFVIYVFVINPQTDSPTPQPGVPIATLIDATHTVVYEDDIARSGAEYASGEYSIESGSAQFLLTSRVSVDLQGPTGLFMHSGMAVSLQRGEARFNCPPNARGFTVHLPDRSKIVDLGTAFRVEIDDDGQPELRVTEGEVEWTPASVQNGPALEPVRIVAGQSARLVDGRPVVLDRVEVFAENFDGFSAPEANFNGGQHETGLTVAFGGTLPGWTVEGFNEPHVVDLDNRYGSEAGDRNFAVMLIHGTLQATLADANDPAQSYEVSLLAGPAVYQNPEQATGEDDALIIEVVRGDGSVLASHMHHPGAWAGEMSMQPVRFEYTGDGSGDLRLRIRPASPDAERFAGAIDDLAVHAIANPSETTSDENETAHDEDSRATTAPSQGDTP